MEKTLFEEISDTYPYLNNTEIRNTLAAFLFTGEDVYKRIDNLSGGERGRVSLAKLMLSESNFLILDEPTNHLDILSKEILEDALNAYEGTLLYVSHDRYFINRTASRILDLTGQKLLGYLGNYDYYLEKKDELEQKLLSDAPESSPKSSLASESKKSWQDQKEQQAKQRKKENDLKKCEAEIARLEQEQSEIEQEMTTPEIATNAAKLQELSSRQESVTSRLETLYETWELLAGDL